MADVSINLIILCLVISVVLGINTLVNYVKHRPLEIKFFLVPLLIFVAGITVGIISSNSNIMQESQEIVTQEETTTKPETEETTTEEETTIAETESEDEFKSSCQEIGYKKLLRTPDDYAGQRIVITAEVQQVIDGGLFDDSKYYRVQTDNNDSGYYFDDEYFMYDNRVDDDMKILDGDVLKIYGEFTGLETMKRVITGSKDEVPAIKAYYIELISE